MNRKKITGSLIWQKRLFDIHYAVNELKIKQIDTESYYMIKFGLIRYVKSIRQEKHPEIKKTME